MSKKETELKSYSNIDELIESLRVSKVERILYSLYRAIYWYPKRVIEHIVRFLQRGKKGYAKSDVWDMDMYLASLISHMLKELRESTTSSPTNIDYNEWKKILFNIEKAFREYIEYKDKDKEIDIEKIKKNMRKLIDHFEDLWD